MPNNYPSLRSDLGRFIDAPRHCSRRATSVPAHAPRPRHLGPIKQLPARSATERAATIYAPEDARRLNALTRHLQGRLQPHLSRRCTHLRGHGGRHGAVRQIHDALHRGTHRYVFRTDVRGYYDAIDPDILMAQLRPHVTDRARWALLYQYLHRCVHRDGVFRRIDFGIPTGCALSPLMAALYLTPLDRAMESLEPSGVFYVRYLDDLIILARNRYKLRQAIRIVNQQLTALRLEQHPDKTFIGKLSRGRVWTRHRPSGSEQVCSAKATEAEAGQRPVPPRATLAQLACSFTRRAQQGAGALCRPALRFDALGSRFDAELGVRGPSLGAVERFATRMVERYAHHEGGESLRHYMNRWLGSHTFGYFSEEPVSPQPKQKQHRYDKHPTAPRSSTPRCPEKNHTSSPPAGLS